VEQMIALAAEIQRWLI